LAFIYNYIVSLYLLQHKYVESCKKWAFSNPDKIRGEGAYLAVARKDSSDGLSSFSIGILKTELSANLKMNG